MANAKSEFQKKRFVRFWFLVFFPFHSASGAAQGAAGLAAALAEVAIRAEMFLLLRIFLHVIL
jgi:hypothetical protein